MFVIAKEIDAHRNPPPTPKTDSADTKAVALTDAPSQPPSIAVQN